MVRDKRPTALTAWIPGVVIQQKGPLTYIVKVCNGKLWKRHIDHLRLSSPPDMQEDSAPYSSAPTVLPAARVDPSTPRSCTNTCCSYWSFCNISYRSSDTFSKNTCTSYTSLSIENSTSDWSLCWHLYAHVTELLTDHSFHFIEERKCSNLL